MLDPNLVKVLAKDLGTEPGLLEKDWHVVRALKILSEHNHADVIPVFSGGTSLSKGWNIIKRFSEDIDFKLRAGVTENTSRDRTRRKEYRERILGVLTAQKYVLADIEKADSDRFFSADFEYPSLFPVGAGLRPHIRVEMKFEDTVLPPVTRPLASLINDAQKLAPEVPSFLCVDPIETAADKLSALAWRVCSRDHGVAGDDPTIVRHLHDLAALAGHIEASDVFVNLVHQAAIKDTKRGGGKGPTNPADRFAMMLSHLRQEKFWAEDYRKYVDLVSFNPRDAISYIAALEALTVLTSRVDAEKEGRLPSYDRNV